MTITNTMFENKDAHLCTWYQSTIGWRSMIIFVIASSDLRLQVLNIQAMRGVELSTNHHLVVRCVRWWGKPLDRSGKPKCVVRTGNVWVTFNSPLWRSFSCMWEYGVRGSLFRDIQSLKLQSDGCVWVLGLLSTFFFGEGRGTFKSEAMVLGRKLVDSLLWALLLYSTPYPKLSS